MEGFQGEDLACIRGERLVFEGLDFAIRPSDALLLAGHNGSGKSSLLRLMGGLLRPAAGRLLANGLPISHDPDAHRARLHYVGHTDPLNSVLTVRESVHFFASLHSSTIVNEEAVLDAIGHFGMSGLADIPGRFLSSGQRRRTNLARLLATHAQLWLLDEPTLGLDESAINALVTATTQHRAQGGMVIAATHTGFQLADAVHLDMSAHTAAYVAARK